MADKIKATLLSAEMQLVVILIIISISLGNISFNDYKAEKPKLDKRLKDATLILMNKYPFNQYSFKKNIVLVKDEITPDSKELVKKETSENGKITTSTYVDSKDNTRLKVAITKNSRNPENKINVTDDSAYKIDVKPKEPENEIPKSQELTDYAIKLCSHDPLYNYELGGREISTKDNEGIDCAHFVGLVYRKNGYDVKEGVNDANVTTLRTTLSDYIEKEFTEKDPIKLSEMKPGDIIIFFNHGHDSHTAIYIGDGKIAHAASEDMGVTITDMQYDEKTGIAGYNHKTVQCIIRRAVEDEVKKKKEPESNEKNIIITELNITEADNTPITNVDISVLINGQEIPLYTVDRIFSNPYIDMTKEVNIEGSKVTVDLKRDEDKAVITTVSDKKTVLTVEPVLKKVTKNIVITNTDKK